MFMQELRFSFQIKDSLLKHAFLKENFYDFILITRPCLLVFIYSVRSLKSIIYEVSQATVSFTSLR